MQKNFDVSRREIEDKGGSLKVRNARRAFLYCMKSSDLNVSFKEIADILEVSIRTVERHLK